MLIIKNSNVKSNDPELILTGRLEYEGLQAHMEEALKEKGLNHKTAVLCPEIALFSKSYYSSICSLDHFKKYDFCFIGSINSCYKERKWVIDFAKKYFTSNSIFINTDTNPDWELLGDFDLSNTNNGFCPKECNNYQSKQVQYRKIEDNMYYFETMCQSKYVLCPAGDAAWSFRFYETLLCHSLPILINHHHCYRTKEESRLKYSYIVTDLDKVEYYNRISDYVYKNLINDNINTLNNHHFLV